MAANTANERIKFIEFYSGIGGWSHALKKVLGEGNILPVGAYDHSTIW
jgi:site-specific DNA-cytosine methylase